MRAMFALPLSSAAVFRLLPKAHLCDRFALKLIKGLIIDILAFPELVVSLGQLL